MPEPLQRELRGDTFHKRRYRRGFEFDCGNHRVNGMAGPETGMFEIPPMSALRRPLTEAEARKWRGGAAIVSPDVLAWLVENDSELAAKLVQLAIYRKMSDYMRDPHGPGARMTAGMRRAEKSFSKVLR